MSRSRGMGLVSAIFLILVVTILVVAISRMVRTSSDAFAQEVLSHRAFLAAESGAQLGLNRVFAPSGTGSCTTQSWDLSNSGLNYCQVTVDCRSETVASTTYYTLQSNGRCEIGSRVAERQVLVRAQP